ncbi:NAD-dependent epimerase/dehydratase family protein [Massilia scottii]|uniref:NAD-dependent epimerase/dehydratase family protein n=1 Tax=Massilia scottii TaxID=3057166 RepID=UPI00279674BC|nr:NAD-dependent epimerase/dehydratase family protein [Massilia sp. CCM 9029]MDQ1831817.1 NAD-dependent epimerase/dehydratase family protein [Massilia sp. CCM 9029]
MRALVTGANGLIGANLCRELLLRECAVRAMTRAGSDRRALHGLALEHVEGDIFDTPASLAALCAGCDVVFHAAARFAYGGISAAELDRTALTGTSNMIDAAALAGVGRVVITSSSVVFGSSTAPLVRDEHGGADDGFVEPPYIQSKIKQDRLAIALGRERGVDILLACPSMSVGPHATVLGPSNGVIVAYLNDPLRLTYPGGCNIVSVRDVAHGHWLIATRGTPGESYILGSENLEWNAIHAAIATLCGVDAPRLEVNHTAAYLAASYEEVRARLQGRAPLTSREQARMIGRYYWYAHAKIAQLGYAPMPARAALAEACAWLAASPHISREVRTSMTLAGDAHRARAGMPSTQEPQ